MKFFGLVIITLMLACASLSAHAASSLSAIRLGTHGEITRIVLEMSNTVGFKTFLLDGPERLVIDLPVTTLPASGLKMPASNSFKGLRHGRYDGTTTRLVIDLAHPAKIVAAFTLPPNAGKPARLVVDITPVNRNAFRHEISKIYRSTPGAPGESVMEASHTIPVPPVPPPRAVPTTKPLIVIDAGHGGVDPGAIGAGNVKEKDVTLALAHHLKNVLERSGRYNVLLSRHDDTYIKLYDRVDFARRKNADMFISIHADSIDKPDVRGASIYTLSNTASDAQTAKLAARENRADLIAGVDLSHENPEVANILIDLAMRDTMNQSRYFAGTVVDQLKVRGVRVLPNPHRYAGFAVLKAADIPSVLIEAGFMSNSEEVSLLRSDAYREKLSTAILSGIDSYFGRVALNQGP